MIFDNIIFHLFILIILGILTIPISSLVKFTIPKNDIVHTRSGLILHYSSEYRPAKRIVTFTVTIPMLPDMCYLIPRNAMNKIPQCRPNEVVLKKLKEEEKLQDNENLPKYERSTSTSTVWSTTTSSSTNYPYTILSTLPKRFRETTMFTPTTPKKREKRQLALIFNIGIGIASMVMSAVDIVISANLKSEMKYMKKSLQTMDRVMQNHQTQLFHLNEGQLIIAQELNHTQYALNKTIALVNEHSAILRIHDKALRTIISQTIFLSTKLKQVVHAVETHFIHTSIEDILANRLNLHFVHQQDMPKVIDLVLQTMNTSFGEADNAIPMVELITRLLVRQHVDFVQANKVETTENGPIIGHLVFTSFFAAPTHDQAPFSVYQLVPIPFNKGKHRVRLAQMPEYVGIEHKSQQFIYWTKEEAETCEFTVMSSCRETPVKRKGFPDECIYQILTDSKLTDCRTELYAKEVFVRRVGQHWAISTVNNTRCHTVTTTEVEEHALTDNEEISLPPVALITTMNTNSLACDRFFLPGALIKTNVTMNLVYNESVNPIEKDLHDLEKDLSNETHWAKLPYIPDNMQAIIDFINSTSKPVTIGYLERWTEHPLSISSIAVIILIIVTGIVLIYYFRTKKTQAARILIKMPSMKELAAMYD